MDESTSADKTSADEQPEKAGDTSTPEQRSETKDAGSRATPRKQPKERTKERGSTLNAVRSGVASAIWLIAVLAALVLAVGALLIALGFNEGHPLVEFVIDTAARIDLGELKSFEGTGDKVLTKWVLVNWGIAALAYLIIGKLLDRLIRP